MNKCLGRIVCYFLFFLLSFSACGKQETEKEVILSTLEIPSSEEESTQIVTVIEVVVPLEDTTSETEDVGSENIEKSTEVEEMSTEENIETIISETEEVADIGTGEDKAEEASPESEILDLIVFYDNCGFEELSMIDEEVEEVLGNIRAEKYDSISAEAGNALISVWDNARRVYYIACMNNGFAYDIENLEDLMKYKTYQEKYRDFPLWLTRFYEYGRVFDSHTYNCGINNVAEAIVEIGEDIPLCENEITTENQKYAMKLAKKMVKVFYEHREDYEEVITAYAAASYEETGKDVYYEERQELISEYWEIIEELPDWFLN